MHVCMYVIAYENTCSVCVYLCVYVGIFRQIDIGMYNI